MPHLAVACKELYVFQRTPSSVDERGNVPTDEDYYFQKIKQEPGWQTVFQENFAGINTGRAKAEEEALDKDIKVKELYNNLGIAYYATKDNIKAKTMFEHAIKLDSNYGHALDNLKNINNIDK